MPFFEELYAVLLDHRKASMWDSICSPTDIKNKLCNEDGLEHGCIVIDCLGPWWVGGR